MTSLIIHAKTKISELIKANPQTIDTLVELNPNFKKLKNPVLRGLLAKRVSISDACRIGGCELEEFLAKMKSIGFNIEASTEPSLEAECNTVDASSFTKGFRIIELDVRPLLAAENDPLKLILETVKGLEMDQCIKIINTFEPLPLINLLNKQGFKSWTERPGKDTVFTWFLKVEKSTPSPGLPVEKNNQVNTGIEFQTQVDSFPSHKVKTIDVRNMAMPLPMLTILENLTLMPPDEALFVLHKKIPVYLLPELTERGFRYFIEQPEEGKIHLFICK